MFPDDLRYTSKHEWVRQGAGSTVRVGITGTPGRPVLLAGMILGALRPARGSKTRPASVRS